MNGLSACAYGQNVVAVSERRRIRYSARPVTTVCSGGTATIACTVAQKTISVMEEPILLLATIPPRTARLSAPCRRTGFLLRQSVSACLRLAPACAADIGRASDTVRNNAGRYPRSVGYTPTGPLALAPALRHTGRPRLLSSV